MYYKQKATIYDSTPDFLAAAKFQAFTGTLYGTGVTVNENGKKIVPAGTLVDANGEVVTMSGGAFSAIPVGILGSTTDVTYTDVDEEQGQPCSLVVEAYIIADRLQPTEVAEYVATTAGAEALKLALPEIKLR